MSKNEKKKANERKEIEERRIRENRTKKKWRGMTEKKKESRGFSFNGISTFVVYLMSKPSLKNSSGTI